MEDIAKLRGDVLIRVHYLAVEALKQDIGSQASKKRGKNLAIRSRTKRTALQREELMRLEATRVLFHIGQKQRVKINRVEPKTKRSGSKADIQSWTNNSSPVQ